MPTLQVRDFPDHMYEEIKRKAQQDHRSIAQQTIYAVERYLKMENEGIKKPEAADVRDQMDAEREERILRRMRIFEEIESRPPHVVPDDFPSSADIIREGRESR